MSIAGLLSLLPITPSYAVPLTCRDRLVKTTGLRACHSIDVVYERSACEIRELRDSRALLSIAGISGMTQVCLCFVVSFDTSRKMK